MPKTWKQDDIDEIADALAESFPDTDPLNVSFPCLHRMIVALDDFIDDPDAVTERRLEDIQMAWYALVEQ